MVDGRTGGDAEPVVAEGTTVTYPDTPQETDRDRDARPVFHVRRAATPSCRRWSMPSTTT